MKILSSLLLIAVFSVALPSCKLLKKKPDDVVLDEKAQAALAIPSYSRNALDGWPEGRKLDPYDSTRVRFPEGIHTYQVGRLPSNDRREMHEAHTVYRIEQNGRWDQRLPATPMAARGPVLGIREPSNNPVPPDAIVSNERSRQLEMSAKLEKQITELRDKGQKLDAFLASAPDKSKTIDELAQQKAKLEQQLTALQAESDELKRELQELKDRQAIQEAMTRKRDTSKKQ